MAKVSKKKIKYRDRSRYPKVTDGYEKQFIQSYEQSLGQALGRMIVSLKATIKSNAKADQSK